MPIKVNLRHLESKNVQLAGELTPEELELTDIDELIHVNEPLQYELEVEQNGENLLVQGKLHIDLDCECSRCLKEYPCPVDLDPYNAYIPLEGEEKAAIHNDLVDLTPYLREDILLAFPQHPLCDAECNGLPSLRESKPGDASQVEKSAWSELDKLKL